MLGMKPTWNYLLILSAFSLSGFRTPDSFRHCEFVRDGECPAEPRVEKKQMDMGAKEIWAHIISGESGGAWPEGSLLVAWTLRSWQVYRGMPAEMAGLRWGWHAWREPTKEAWDAVNAVWGKPMTESPFSFMWSGNYCVALGSNSDKRYWRSIGWYNEPDFDIQFDGTDYGMNCYWRAAGGN